MSIRRTVAGRLASYHRVVMWGAGGMGRTALREWLPAEKVVAVFDSDPEKAGQTLERIPIMAPERILEASADCIVICTHVQAQVRAVLNESGVQVPIFYIYELFLPEAGWQALSPIACLRIDIAAAKTASWPVFLLQKPQIFINVTFRYANAARSSLLTYPLYPLFYVLHYLTCAFLSIQLPIETTVGPGLIFAHYGTIVFTARARIGAFFTIYHGCTIGTDSSGRGPVIGDFVTQFAGSHILGQCTLGKNIRVGANAVVIGLNAPDNVTLVGIPARIVSRRAGE